MPTYLGAAQIVISQATLSPGVAGVPRDDGVTGQVVTLRNADNTNITVNKGGWRWRLYAPRSSTATLSSPTSPSCTFTPDVDGTYLVTLEVNEGLKASQKARSAIAVRSGAGFRYPAQGESLENTWTSFYTGNPNETGWWEDLDRILRSVQASIEGTLVTVDPEPGIPNSRQLAVGSGLSLTDNGAGSDIVIDTAFVAGTRRLDDNSPESENIISTRTNEPATHDNTKWGQVNLGSESGAGFGTAANFATVSGGRNNKATAVGATVGGGITNAATGQNSIVSGGVSNTASSAGAVVAGGDTNTASGSNAGIVAGISNTAGGPGAFIGGGASCGASAQYAAAVGGAGNIASGDAAFCGSGSSNNADGGASAVVAGRFNETTNTYAGVLCGESNNAGGESSAIAGGVSNTTSDIGSFIGGGNGNAIGLANGAIGAGTDNQVTADRGFVGAGDGNEAGGSDSAVAGGVGNSASVPSSFIGAGANNIVSGDRGAVCGGSTNLASGADSFVGSGDTNTAGGSYSSVPGGRSSSASNTDSHAWGRGATAGHDGAIVVKDGSAGTVSSSAANEITLYGSGNIRLMTNGGKTVHRLSSSSNVYGERLMGLRSTTDATAQTQTIATIPSGQDCTVTVILKGKQSGSANCKTFYYVATYTNNGGAVALTGAAHVNSTQATGLAAATVGVGISGTNLELQFQGIAATTIRWSWDVQVHYGGST